MALSASGWKYISSSGATNPLGRGFPVHPDRGRWRASFARLAADSSGERRRGPRARVVMVFSRHHVVRPMCYVSAMSPVVGESAFPLVRRWQHTLPPPQLGLEGPILVALFSIIHLPPWSDVRLPAELKHITKRRRRKQP